MSRQSRATVNALIENDPAVAPLGWPQRKAALTPTKQPSEIAYSSFILGLSK
ncbi:hypothetical protein ACMAY6_10310 [Luminiphilus sp. nBUS_16]|uniref:hypothetical protein n=1 Tax=Luminiphilus sp. nBUS_16 TaxID=3395315 RepID=UPI003EBCA14F